MLTGYMFFCLFYFFIVSRGTTWLFTGVHPFCKVGNNHKNSKLLLCFLLHSFPLLLFILIYSLKKMLHASFRNEWICGSTSLKARRYHVFQYFRYQEVVWKKVHNVRWYFPSCIVPVALNQGLQAVEWDPLVQRGWMCDYGCTEGSVV